MVFKAEKTKSNYSGMGRNAGLHFLSHYVYINGKITPACRLLGCYVFIKANTNKFHIVSIMSDYL